MKSVAHHNFPPLYRTQLMLIWGILRQYHVSIQSCDIFKIETSKLKTDNKEK